MTIAGTPGSSGYISLPVTVNPNTLFQAAVAAIRAQIPGWTPSEGQLDVAILEEAAQIMSVCATVATQVPETIFAWFGKLVGITPIPGAKATAPVRFTMANTAGYTIPAGTVVAYPLSGNAQILFSLKTPVVIAKGTTTGSGTLVCTTVGTFANTLAAATCQMVTTFAQVSSVATTATSSGGAAADTQQSYLNRLSNELQLLAPRPILPADFATLARNVTGVYRALALNGLSPGRTISSATMTSGSKTVSAATGNFTSLDVGRSVTGTGIPATTVISTVTANTIVQLSQTATSSGTAAITLGILKTQQRCVAVCGLTTKGAPLSGAVNAALLAYLEAKREVNFVVSAITPTFTQIDVSVTCYATASSTTSAVQAAVAAALSAFLDPATWGGGGSQLPTWTPAATEVRFLDVANVIRSTPGVLYIPSGTLKMAIHGNAKGTADVVLPGNAPVAKPGTILVTVEAS